MYARVDAEKGFDGQGRRAGSSLKGANMASFVAEQNEITGPKNAD